MHARLLLILPFLPAFASAQVSAHAGFQVSVPAIRVNIPPPAVRVEAQSAAPGPDFVWIGGYWGWENRAHVWVPGHWERPPGRHYTWVQTRWERKGKYQMYHQGHWAYEAPPPDEKVQAYDEPAPVQEEVYVEQRPPRPIVERRPPPPWRGGLWVNGNWRWGGNRWQWVGGRWERPRPGYVHHEAQWKENNGRWVYEHERWDDRRGPDRRGPDRRRPHPGGPPPDDRK